MGKSVKHQKCNWTEYFRSIREACPWSGVYYGQGRIEISRWRRRILPLSNLRARVYTYTDSLRRLKHQVKQIEPLHPEYIFFISQPSWPNGTPQLCVIQQDREELQKLRHSIGFITEPNK